MCLKFFKKKFKKKLKKKKSETYLKNSPDNSPLISINGEPIISNIEKDLYNNRDYEQNPLMESLSNSLSPPHYTNTNYPIIYKIGNYDEEDITCSDDSIYFPDPELKLK